MYAQTALINTKASSLPGNEKVQAMTPPVTRIDAPTFNSSEGTISQQCTLQNKPSKTASEASASTSGKYQVRKTRLRPKDVKRKMWERTFGSLVARVFSGHIFFNPRSLMSPRRLATAYLRHSDSIHTPVLLNNP